jgi:hypothetical protein
MTQHISGPNILPMHQNRNCSRSPSAQVVMSFLSFVKQCWSSLAVHRVCNENQQDKKTTFVGLTSSNSFFKCIWISNEFFSNFPIP